MNSFLTKKHFAGCQNLCPEVLESGGKAPKKGRSPTHRSGNRVAQSLRVCAQTLLRSKCVLAACGRRIKSRDGAVSALTVITRKLMCVLPLLKLE
ncbi:hypothetical protein, partial [Rhodopirellula bahusiensis]|uniref:hypothetical protein n=1 Tax=Rhodopirellula bahusiensis TaxID=2014065 RepID=UPI0032A0BADF